MIKFGFGSSTVRPLDVILRFRFVCSNGLIIGVTRADVRRRHVGALPSVGHIADDSLSTFVHRDMFYGHLLLPVTAVTLLGQKMDAPGAAVSRDP